MATLTTTIIEEINLNNKDRGSKNVKITSSIDQVIHRIYEVDTVYQSTLISFLNVGDSVQNINEGDLKYIRITNLGTSTVRLNILGTGEEYFVDLPAKGSFILNNDLMDANDQGIQTPTMNTIATIRAIALIANSDVEILAAGSTS